MAACNDDATRARAAERATAGTPPPVAVCICTCRRPQGLRTALAAVAAQDYAGALNVVVVDNHPDRDGERVCAALADGYRLPLTCVFEPRPGISHAREAALNEALRLPVELVAMFDDDEWPEPGWLSALVAAQRVHDADIVGGPIEPAFDVAPPDWMIKGRFFHHPPHYGTGNVLYSARMLRACDGGFFDHRLGLSGGEDFDFAKRMMAAGHVFVSADAAVVHERIPAARLALSYIAKRSFRDGNIKLIWDRNQHPSPWREGLRLLSIGRKLLYAGEHLVLSVAHPWHLCRCLQDLVEAVGMTVGLFNFVYLFYTVEHDRPRRLQWNPVRRRLGH